MTNIGRSLIVVVTVLCMATRYPRGIEVLVPALLSLVIVRVGQSHVVLVLGNILYPTYSACFTSYPFSSPPLCSGEDLLLEGNILTQ